MKFEIKIKNTEKLLPKLEVLLASQYVLSMKLKNYHWNIVSTRFIELHEYFEQKYNLINSQIDEVAERIRTLWEFVNASSTRFVEISKVKELKDGKVLSDNNMLEKTWKDFLVILELLKEASEIAVEIGDEGTESLLTSFIEVIEKEIWILNSMNILTK